MRERLSAWSLSFRVGPMVAGLVVAAMVVAACGSICGAEDEPKPDPAGVVTGDRTSVFDAGGTSFVVAEPTDKTAPDYVEKEKDY
jgi:hypothetical protein